MEQTSLDYQPVRTLRGCILQAKGDVVAAAEAYRSAGAYYPQLGEEFLATAEGLQARGQPERAWREALTSKFMRPGNPRVHLWLADNLPKIGSSPIPALERQIADLLGVK